MLILDIFKLCLSIATKVLLVTLLVTVHGACTWQYTAQKSSDGLRAIGLRAHYSVSREHKWLLPPKTIVVIDVPIIKPELELRYPEFRQQLIDALYQSANVRFSAALQINQVQDQGLLQEKAKEYGAAFILVPSVDWIVDDSAIQDNHKMRALRPTRDQITLHLKVMDVQNYALLDTVIVQASSVYSRKNLESVDQLLKPAFNAVFTKI